MRLKRFVNELSSQYGKGITFLDIDETIFRTFAKIYVLKHGQVIKKLTNQEFNTYELQDGESFDFGEFRSAEMFNKTSIPIPKTINRIKRIFKNIDRRGSKVVFLTARADFDDKEPFLDKFRSHGIPIDNIYVERAGNSETGTTSQRKEAIVMKYLNTGLYRRVRLIDDDMANIKGFLSIEKRLPDSLINKVKKIHGIEGEESLPPIEFFGLFVKPNGSLKRIT